MKTEVTLVKVYKDEKLLHATILKKSEVASWWDPYSGRDMRLKWENLPPREAKRKLKKLEF